MRSLGVEGCEFRGSSGSPLALLLLTWVSARSQPSTVAWRQVPLDQVLCANVGTDSECSSTIAYVCNVASPRAREQTRTTADEIRTRRRPAVASTALGRSAFGRRDGTGRNQERWRGSRRALRALTRLPCVGEQAGEPGELVAPRGGGVELGAEVWQLGDVRLR